MTKFLIRLRGLLGGNTPGIGLNPGARSSGLALERITIDDKRGATHTVFFGFWVASFLRTQENPVLLKLIDLNTS